VDVSADDLGDARSTGGAALTVWRRPVTTIHHSGRLTGCIAGLKTPASSQPNSVMVLAKRSARSYVSKVLKHLGRLPGCQPYTLYSLPLDTMRSFLSHVHVRESLRT
jgi:hypothetical protein